MINNEKNFNGKLNTTYSNRDTGTSPEWTYYSYPYIAPIMGATYTTTNTNEVELLKKEVELLKKEIETLKLKLQHMKSPDVYNGPGGFDIVFDK